MITSYSDYKHYISEDQKAFGAFTKFPIFNENLMILLTDPCWKFVKLMRKLEYFTNCKKIKLLKPYLWFLRKRYQKTSLKLGFSIPINVFCEGLSIEHFGSIVVSRHAKIGKYCTINSCVNIGGVFGEADVVIGDHCYIGPGAKIFGNIKIGNYVKIGANAVVNKSFIMDNQTIVGIPARSLKTLA